MTGDAVVHQEGFNLIRVGDEDPLVCGVGRICGQSKGMPHDSDVMGIALEVLPDPPEIHVNVKAAVRRSEGVFPFSNCRLSL